MATLPGMTRDDSRRVGFAMAALWSDAITLDELKTWCEKLLLVHEPSELPGYVFELIEYDGSLAKIYKLIGFVPHDGLNQQERNALYGIALMRGARPTDWPVKPEAASRALNAKPTILERFREEFPFISL